MKIYENVLTMELSAERIYSNDVVVYDVQISNKDLEALSELHGSPQRLLRALVSAHLSREEEKAYKRFVRGILELNALEQLK